MSCFFDFSVQYFDGYVCDRLKLHSFMQVIEICRIYELDSISSNIMKVSVIWCKLACTRYDFREFSACCVGMTWHGYW
jgi:hypothetical protein